MLLDSSREQLDFGNRKPRAGMEPDLPSDLPDKLNILVMTDEELDVDAVRAVAPDRIADVRREQPAAFEDEAGMFPPPTGLKSYREPWHTELTPAARGELLAKAHVLVISLPYPLRLRDRMPSLLWAHATYAGVSDFSHSDLWGTGVTLTSGRGIVQALPIAEMVIAAALSFAKELGLAQRQTEARALDGAAYHLKLIAGKTMGIVGLGGIGAEIARLARAIGMRVVATRRSATTLAHGMDGVDGLYPPARLHEMLSGCDFVAVTTALTAETQGLLDDAAFASMKEGAYVLNVARGEVIDEGAMKAALLSGRLAGAYLDVYADERSVAPDPELMAFPNVVLTPHNSGETDVDHWPMTEQFIDNLRRFLDGTPLLNVVDWERGY